MRWAVKANYEGSQTLRGLWKRTESSFGATYGWWNADRADLQNPVGGKFESFRGRVPFLTAMVPNKIKRSSQDWNFEVPLKVANSVVPSSNILAHVRKVDANDAPQRYPIMEQSLMSRWINTRTTKIYDWGCTKKYRCLFVPAYRKRVSKIRQTSPWFLGDLWYFVGFERQLLHCTTLTGSLSLRGKE